MGILSGNSTIAFRNRRVHLLNQSRLSVTPGQTPENFLKMAEFATPNDKMLSAPAKLTRKESYKAQRKSYREEKKRVADELLNSLKDPSVIVLADWLKIRGTLKSWTKLWCILKPGLLLLYKSPKAKENNLTRNSLFCKVYRTYSSHNPMLTIINKKNSSTVFAGTLLGPLFLNNILIVIPTSENIIMTACADDITLCSNHWVGTILLNACQVIERPSKKDGFCFKLFHPLEQSIWAPKGPEKETIGAVVQPLPTSYLIFRAPSQAAGKCWLDALELSLRCSTLLVRSVSNRTEHEQEQDHTEDQDATTNHDTQWSEADFEKHFQDHGDTLSEILRRYSPCTPTSPQRKLLNPGFIRNTPSPYGLYPSLYSIGISPCPSPNPVFQRLYHAVAQLEKDYLGSVSDLYHSSSDLPHLPSDSDGAVGGDHVSGAEQVSMTESDSEGSVKGEEQPASHEVEDPPETPYILKEEGEFGSQGEQVEELAEEHKSLIWYLVKQVRPGMDLSKVVLPTFILEPRSFLDKLADSYYHADILSRAVLEADAFTRMKIIVQWYLSGFYKKPKGLKKPYNPILGETFRCYWKHPKGSRTFYLAEQVSHHPPVSAFYVTNRQDGFSISGSILAKSKFYGNSTSAILDGVAVLNLLPRGEEYTMTVPYALCKGILMGTLTMELGGKVAIECEKTGYKTELEFKLKPFLGGSDNINGVTGKLRLGKETLATIDGYWDSVVNIKDKRTGEEQAFWNPTPTVRQSRLPRYTVQVQDQGEFESERLWEKVSAAIAADDQIAATEEKTILEDAQRAAAKQRKDTSAEWISKHFEQNLITGAWIYKHIDFRPWDPRNDLIQYEYNYFICTKTKHQTPMIRTASIVSVDPQTIQPLLQTESRSSLSVLKSSKRRMTSKAKRQESISSSQDGEVHSDSSQWEDRPTGAPKVQTRLLECFKEIQHTLRDHNDKLAKLQQTIELIGKMQRERDKIKEKKSVSIVSPDTLLLIGAISILQLILVWFFYKKY